jgi:hypothetical protein
MKATKESMFNSEQWQAAGYTNKKRLNKNEVYLWNGEQTELWIRRPGGYAGYTITIGKYHYEFCGSVPDIRFCSECETWETK